MVRVPGLDSRGTGEGSNSTASTSHSGREYGRKLAVGVVLEDDSGPSARSDGGLSPAAQAWMRATPGVDVEDARRYDRENRIHREIARRGPRPPRGEPGSPTNWDRADVVNAARRALREYRELAEQADSGAE
jgi:hypothetical protein